MTRNRIAFTLLEVVVAIGIFAIGMVAVIGLFSPVVKSVGDSADAEAATRIADLLKVKLEAEESVDASAGTPFKTLAARLKVVAGAGHQLTNDDRKSDYNPATDTQLLFASRDGTKIGAFDDLGLWGVDPATRGASSREKYFEIALIRNEAISPNDPVFDAAAPVLAYTARVRWPAFVAPVGGGSGIQPAQSAPGAPVAFDHSQKQVLFFSGAITR